MMTLRERILTVYRGETPDVVPFMLDLSHWFYQKNRLPWDISKAYEQPEYALIDYHTQVGAGFYVPNLGSFYSAAYADDVQAETLKDERGPRPEISWRLTTPLGGIERRRVWKPESYSWAISRWGITTEQDLRVLGYALGSRTFAPRWEKYHAWDDYVGDTGIVCLLPGYSAVGYLMHYWMGVERLMYAMADWPETVHAVVEQINGNNLQMIDLLATAPGDVAIMGDNFSSDMQPPHFFAEWSRAYYAEAIRRLHAAGKKVAVHIDGKLRGAIAMLREVGMDCVDAVTPTPMGDLTPAECRDEAGPDCILSGGVSPDLWYDYVPEETFVAAVKEWLDLKRRSPRLIANAGDQVPPGAAEERITLMRELVEEYGRY